MQIATVKLDGKSYLTWSRSAILLIQSRGLYHYLTENSRKSEETDPLYVKWEAWNSLVMSWLMHSMLPNISRLLLTTAQEIWIWTAMSQTYSQIENDVQVYELVTREHDTKQDKRSLAEYYAELRAIWPEIDFVEDSKLIMLLKRWSINSRFNKLRFLSFLVVLNQDYDQVRSKIIGRSPFPTLRQAYAALQSEESRRNVMVYNNQQE